MTWPIESAFAKTSSLWLFSCIYSIPCKFSEQKLVSHWPVTENLVLFVAPISECNFFISFIFDEDSFFASLLTLVAGPESTALETWILEKRSPDSGDTPRHSVTRSQVKYMDMGLWVQVGSSAWTAASNHMSKVVRQQLKASQEGELGRHLCWLTMKIESLVHKGGKSRWAQGKMEGLTRKSGWENWQSA